MLTHLRLDPGMDKAIEEAVEVDFYKSKSEFIRTAIREKLEERRKEYAIAQLAKFRGIIKGKPMTREERAEAVREGMKSKRNVFKEFGLE